LKRVIVVSIILITILIAAAHLLARSSGTMRISVDVSEELEVSEKKNLQLQTYTETLGENVIDSNDISLDFGEDVPVNVKIASGVAGLEVGILLDEVMLEDGFAEQLHVEVLEDDTITVEVCDSLADVPFEEEDEEKVIEEIFDSTLPEKDETKTVTVEVTF